MADLKAGTLDNFSSSLAAEMEAAFETAWAKYQDEPLRAAGRTERQLLFSAVAQGLLRYLRDNDDAFDVETTIGLDTHDGTVTINVVDNFD